MVDVEEKAEYKVKRKSGIEQDTENAGNKVKAGAKQWARK